MDETLITQSDKPHAIEAKASSEVERALAEIQATESDIAAQTGLEGQELIDTTDDFLTEKAKHAADVHASDTAQIVETALIEGALEEIGERPESEHNPIVKLEKEGYNEQVTDGVQKLHEQHATLPDGTSAAGVVAHKASTIEGLTPDQSEHYDTNSKEAGWDSPERAQRLVESYITPDSKVLDIGIGTGQAVNGYAEKGATVIGLDHDELMLTAAESIVGEHGSLRQADINTELPISDLKESVDVVQAIGVLEFAEDLPKIFEQVHGSLKENGVFVFTAELVDDTHPEKSEYENVGLTVHRHSIEQIRGLLEKKGYTLLNSETYAGYEREDGKVPYGIFLAHKSETAKTPEQELAQVFAEVRPVLESSDEEFERSAKEFISKRVAELSAQSSIDVSEDLDLDSESIQDFIPAEVVMEPDAESNGFRLDDPEAYTTMLGQIRRRYQRMIEKSVDNPETAYRSAVVQGTHDGQAAYFGGFTGGNMARRQSLLFLDLDDERQPVSVAELKGQAYCFERAGLVHNMLTISGVPSSLETGRLTTTKSDGSSTNEFHALLRIEPTQDKQYLFDVMNPSLTVDESGKLVSAKPSLYSIKGEWQGSLRGTLSSQKKKANGDIEVTKTSQLKFESGGRFS